MSLSRCCNAPNFLFTTKRNTPAGTKLRYEVDTSGILPITTEIFKMLPDVSSPPLYECLLFSTVSVGISKPADLMCFISKVLVLCSFDITTSCLSGYAVFQVAVQEMCCHWKWWYHQEQQMWKGN